MAWNNWTYHTYSCYSIAPCTSSLNNVWRDRQNSFWQMTGHNEHWESWQLTVYLKSAQSSYLLLSMHTKHHLNEKQKSRTKSHKKSNVQKCSKITYITAHDGSQSFQLFHLHQISSPVPISTIFCHVSCVNWYGWCLNVNHYSTVIVSPWLLKHNPGTECNNYCRHTVMYWSFISKGGFVLFVIWQEEA